MTTFSDPTATLADHVEAMIRLDEILHRHFPTTTSGQRIAAVAEILASGAS